MTRGRRPRLARAVREGVLTMTAAVVVAVVAWALDPEPGTIVFALFLSISLSRSQLERDLRGRLEAGIALPLVALAGAGVGMLLVASPWVGASVFVAGLTASVLLRRYGAWGRRLGGLVALPFTVLLVAPVGGPSLTPVHRLVVAGVVGLVAWATVTIVQLLAQRAGMLPRAPARETVRRDATRPSARQDASVRLAAQMAVTLAVAFFVGFVFFPDHWAWIVLTGLLVALGTAGRADAVHTGVQRVIGAGAGSLLVFVLPVHLPAPWAVSLVLVALFAGVVLRPFGYVWWTLSVTVSLALAQSFWTGGFVLWERWVEIVLGAAIAIVVAWIVLPIRSEDVVRRRISQVLAALADLLAADGADPAGIEVETLRRRVGEACAGMQRAVAPFEALGRISGGRIRLRPCGWADAVRTAADALGRTPRAGARRAVGQARRAVRHPDALQSALDALVAAVS